MTLNEFRIFSVAAKGSSIPPRYAHNWISPCGSFFGASHCGTQIVIKARNSSHRDGWLLTAGFRNSSEPSHCCWQEISSWRWCAEQGLICSGLLQLKGTGPEVMYYGKSGDHFSHSFLQSSAVDLLYLEHLYWIHLCLDFINFIVWFKISLTVQKNLVFKAHGGVCRLKVFSLKYAHTYSWVVGRLRQTNKESGKIPQLTHCEYQWKMQKQPSLLNTSLVCLFKSIKTGHSRGLMSWMQQRLWNHIRKKALL